MYSTLYNYGANSNGEQPITGEVPIINLKRKIKWPILPVMKKSNSRSILGTNKEQKKFSINFSGCL